MTVVRLADEERQNDAYQVERARANTIVLIS